MKNKNKILTSLFVICVCLSTVHAWKVDKDGTTQMKLTDDGRLWIGADGPNGKPKFAATVSSSATASDEDRAITARIDRPTGNNYGIVATAYGDGADMNVALYGFADRATNNYGLYVSSGYGYFADRVGIGTTDPSYELQVAGITRIDSYLSIARDPYYQQGYDFVFAIDGDAVGNSWYRWSDKRLKNDIHTITNALEKVTKLRGVNFKWKDVNKSQKTQMGFIAQEVEEVIPEVVSKPVNNKDFYNMDYANLTALLVESVKELKKQNDVLKTLVCQDHPHADICMETSK